jgi:16S rRNA (cytidine1402-2'-O)-methyltransferase
MTRQGYASTAPGTEEAEPKGSEAPGKSRDITLAPGLYVTATPIGNARDITLRALDVLHACDVIAAEDTRVTAKLLAIHGIRKTMVAYNDHSATHERPKLIARLKLGARVALVSDAGTPLVSDPGYKLVRAVLADNIAVHAVPGVSACLTALTLAGLPTDRFLFAGFLPNKQGARREMLEQVKDVRATLIFFESPQRLAESLIDMTIVLGNRMAAIARELTKLHEEMRRGPLGELARSYERPPKGEVTVLVAPPNDVGPDFARIDALLDQALPFMPVRAASDLIASALDVPRRAVYDRAIERKNTDD